jgi:hypothetical protein
MLHQLTQLSVTYAPQLIAETAENSIYPIAYGALAFWLLGKYKERKIAGSRR